MRPVHLVLGCLALAAQTGEAASTATCTDANIVLPPEVQEVKYSQSQFDQPQIQSIKVTVKFRDLKLQTFSGGATNFTCSLYSKIPESFAAQGLTAKITNSKFNFSSKITDAGISGKVKFQTGAVDPAPQNAEKDHYMEAGGALGDSSARYRSNPNLARIMRAPRQPIDDNAIGGSEAKLRIDPRGNALPRSIILHLGSTASGNSISSNQRIANEFTVQLDNASGFGATGSVVLESVEFTLTPIEFLQ